MIKSQLLKASLSIDDFNLFVCPKCDFQLRANNKKPDFAQSADSWFCMEYADSSPEYYSGVFFLRLVCPNKECNENIYCVGNFNTKEEINTLSNQQQYTSLLFPEYFTPPIHIFKLHKVYPEDVSLALLEAFSQFWISPSSSANSVRIAVERLMDHYKVKKYAINKKQKRVRICLDKRISFFSEKKPDVAEKLRAIKWIGNDGAHSISARKDVISSFKLMEHALEELFLKNRIHLGKLAKRINKAKKPVS